MRKGVCAFAVLALALALSSGDGPLPGAVHAAEVRLAPVGRHFGAPPPLGRKQGWLSITNRDWMPYYLAVNRKDKLFLYRAGDGHGGVLIPSGTTVTLALEKETYDMYGTSSERLKVRVREGRTTTLSLEPFGFVGNTGLRGVVNDGDRVRNEVLFDNYSTVVVRPTPVPVIVNRPPPPPPPPVIIGRPPYHRPPPPPPPPPPPRRHRDSWGFVFGMSR